MKSRSVILLLFLLASFANAQYQRLALHATELHLAPKGSSEVEVYCVDPFIVASLSYVDYNHVLASDQRCVQVGNSNLLTFSEAISRGYLAVSGEGPSRGLYLKFDNLTNEKIEIVTKTGTAFGSEPGTFPNPEVLSSLRGLGPVNESNQNIVWDQLVHAHISKEVQALSTLPEYSLPGGLDADRANKFHGEWWPPNTNVSYEQLGIGMQQCVNWTSYCRRVAASDPPGIEVLYLVLGRDGNLRLQRESGQAVCSPSGTDQLSLIADEVSLIAEEQADRNRHVVVLTSGVEASGVARSLVRSPLRDMASGTTLVVNASDAYPFLLDRKVTIGKFSSIVTTKSNRYSASAYLDGGGVRRTMYASDAIKPNVERFVSILDAQPGAVNESVRKRITGAIGRMRKENPDVDLSRFGVSVEKMHIVDRFMKSSKTRTRTCRVLPGKRPGVAFPVMP